MKKDKSINRIKKSREDYIIDAFVYVVLAALIIACAYPVWYILVASVSSSTHVLKNPGLLLVPDEISLEAYRLALQHPLLSAGFWNSIKVLLYALPINMVLTLMCGYFMASTNMMFKKPIVGMLLLTMYFGGGLIPAFLNVKELGLYDSIWALVLPGALSVYNSLICKTAIEGVPESLRESAYLDGANDFQILFKIIVPLIIPTLAVLVLYYGVSHWNSWFAASIYIETPSKLPIQNILKSILSNAAGLSSEGMGDTFSNYAESIKYSAIVIATVPIMCVYPFLQKHFTKGVMIGAVKG